MDSIPTTIERLSDIHGSYVPTIVPGSEKYSGIVMALLESVVSQFPYTIEEHATKHGNRMVVVLTPGNGIRYDDLFGIVIDDPAIEESDFLHMDGFDGVEEYAIQHHHLTKG